MTIIPAIDIIDGKCVRLTKGDYNSKTIYDEDPLRVAMQFQDAGLERLHLVDLDGAKAGSVKNWAVLENIAAKTNLVIDFSGGISNEDQLNKAFNAGAFYVTIGSMVVKDETTVTEWISNHETRRFIIGADTRDEKVLIKGWIESTAISLSELINKYMMRGINQFMCTDINRDGLMKGPSFRLYEKILNEQPAIHLIASGGIASFEDLVQLKELGCKGAVIGKALFEKKITLSMLKKFMYIYGN